jgi:hypothetical protein
MIINELQTLVIDNLMLVKYSDDEELINYIKSLMDDDQYS